MLPTFGWLRSHAAIAFDVDDTLLRTFERSFRKTVHTAALLGCEPPTRRAFLQGYLRGDQEAGFREWFASMPFKEVQRVYDGLQSDFPDEPLLDFPLLRDRLRSLGLQDGVLSNSPSWKLNRKLECLGGPERLSFSLGGDDLPEAKPSPRAFDPLLRACLLEPPDVLYVGNSAGDWEAARRAGISFLHVRSGPQRWTPPPTVRNVLEVRMLLDLV